MYDMPATYNVAIYRYYTYMLCSYMCLYMYVNITYVRTYTYALDVVNMRRTQKELTWNNQVMG
jgi:hypothetical protein